MLSGASVVFNSVGKNYGKTRVLADFNLDVKPGEFMTLLGPSGSGKTTALNALAGFVEDISGDILIDGKSVGSLPPEKRNVGMVFQSYSLFPHMTVAENVGFPLRLRKMGKAEIARRVGSALEMVQLSSYGHRMPRELSGGQRQRVAFARAIVYEPSVLLMDEPLAALDLKLRDAMRLEIKRYHSQLGCTIIFVTHDQGEALALSDRIAVMSDGRIAQVGNPVEIYDHPRSRFVADFIGQTNLFSVEFSQNAGFRLVEMDAEFSVADWRMDPRGKPAQISIRPENLKLIAEPAHGVVSSKAIIEEVLFLGNLIEYSIVLPGGTKALVHEHRSANKFAAAKGERVLIGFSLQDASPVFA